MEIISSWKTFRQHCNIWKRQNLNDSGSQWFFYSFWKFWRVNRIRIFCEWDIFAQISVENAAFRIGQKGILIQNLLMKASKSYKVMCYKLYAFKICNVDRELCFVTMCGNQKRSATPSVVLGMIWWILKQFSMEICWGGMCCLVLELLQFVFKTTLVSDCHNLHVQMLE